MLSQSVVRDDTHVTAHGRALAMDRPGALFLSGSRALGFGGASACGDAGQVSLADTAASGQVSAVVSASAGTVSLTGALVWIESGHRGIGLAGALVLTGAVAVPGVSASAHARLESLDVRVQEFLLHRIGASLAGAQYTLMARTNPVHPVMEYDSQGPTDSDVISSVPVLWLDVMVSNSGTGTLYLMCFDSATVPIDGTLPMRQPLQVGAGGQTYVDLGDPGADGISGRPTKNGLSWVASTTATTLTTDATNSLWVTARTITIGT